MIKRLSRSPATIAVLFLAIGGSATAAKLLTGKDAVADGEQSLATLAQLGELDAADAVVAGTGFAGEIFDLVPLNRVLYARDALRLAQGRTEEGLADLRELGARDARAAVVAPGEPWRTALAHALLDGGDDQEARVLRDEQLALARAARLRGAEGAALRGLAGDDAERIPLLREAAAALAGSEARLEEARALLDLGAALGGGAALEPLERALGLATEGGAPPLAQAAQARLEAVGAKPRRLAVSGADALPTAERRVAGMAADGQTNKEIAQALFLTAKTVENHLGRVYVKLGIHSRRELSGALAVT